MVQEKVLITGSEGYFGSILKSYLQKKYLDIRCLDTNFFSNCYLYKNEIGNHLYHKDVRFISEDDLEGVGTVVHLAGISNDPFGGLLSEEVYDFSLDYTERLASLCKKKNINFIFASSCSVYGKTKTTEELNEKSQTNPQTGYSKNKLQIENILLDQSDVNFKPIILRFSTLYGLSPKMRFDIVINMLTGMAVSEKEIQLNSNGLAWRPFIHILDACKAIYLSINAFKKSPDFQIFNIGSTHENYRIIDIAKIIENIVDGSKIIFLNKDDSTVFADKKIQDGVDTRTYKVNFERAEKYINFKTDFRVIDGVKQMKKKFEEINLTPKKLKEIKYYRLQKMNELYESGKINKKLLWER